MKEKLHTKKFLAFLRILNVIALIIFVLFVGTSIKESLDFNGSILTWIIIFGLSPIIATTIVSYIINKHEFYEWNKKERQKRKSFLTTISLTVFLFTYLSNFLVNLFIIDLNRSQIHTLSNPEKIVLLIKLFFGLLFLVNAIFTVQLHYTLYSDDLELGTYPIQKKPDNWDWERTDEDDIEDRIKGF